MNHYLLEVLSERLNSLGWPTETLRLSRPNDSINGDASTNIALTLARTLKKSPITIADELLSGINFDKSIVSKYEIANPGFINFFQAQSNLHEQLVNVLVLGSDFGKNNIGLGKTAQVEFVSANPTGPLTVGHGRQTILGDTISNILEWSHYDVTREYYFNNAGRQMRMLGESLKVRYLNLKGDKLSLPDGGYEGDYIIEIAKRLLSEKPTLDNDSDIEIFKSYAEENIFNLIKKTLQRIHVQHDVFYNEKSLYDEGKIDAVIDELRLKELVYEKDGAHWFKTTELGFDQDRVLIKSTGEPTYRLPDIAYHREKVRRGFDLIIDIFGADHMDTYPDVLAALNALGTETSAISVVIHQFVTLLKNGEMVKMSTRKAEFVTLDELIDEVGIDVVRYFYIMRSANSHLNFDLDLAKRQTEENPVFYLQYAHARVSSIFRRAKQRDLLPNENIDYALLDEPSTIALLNQILFFPDVVKKCLSTLEVHHLPNYLYDLAGSLHKFYSDHKVLSNDIALTHARLQLLKAAQLTLKNGLAILGVTAPESM